MDEHKTNIQLSDIVELGKKIPLISTEDEYGSGFFLRIPYKDVFKKVLVTNNHVLTTEMQNNEAEFEFSFNEKEEIINNVKTETKETRTIKLDKNERFIFSIDLSKEDVTIVEILEKDNLPEYLFLEYDEEYLSKGYQTYLGREIVVFQHPKGKPICYGQGKFVEFHKTYLYNFYHSTATEPGSSGSPIILKENLKVIGLHCGSEEVNNYATLFGEIIDRVNEGTKNYSDGRKFIGRIVNDKANGFGTMTFPNDVKYYGEFKNDLPHGRIKITKKENGKTYLLYQGEFVRGIKQGKAVNNKKLINA